MEVPSKQAHATSLIQAWINHPADSHNQKTPLLNSTLRTYTDHPADAALDIPSTATQQQIRDAYKKAALKTHPDRVASDSPERAERTRKFQLINDAYYTLSDASRRRDYDAARVYHGFGSGASTASTAWDSDEDIPVPDPNAEATGSGAGGFPWSSFGFSSKAKNAEEEQRFENEQFGDVFEEMLREEGMAENGGTPTGKFWSVVGGLSGGAMGFIVANFPGSKFSSFLPSSGGHHRPSACDEKGSMWWKSEMRDS